MLVLTRKLGQKVVIGRGDRAITVTVLRCFEGHVRLGFEAPDDLKILRSELIDREEANSPTES